ncbi:MAG: hypothetical protein Q4A01_00065 [Coriobacteriales bacterium]|nr:hypothetical protein [Coriobacteriales bacterium]
MNSDMDHPKLGALYEEHMILGATFGPSLEPVAYVGDADVLAGECLADGALVCDASMAKMLLLGGSDAAGYMATTCAGPLLDVGGCGFGAVLTGDGGVASIPLIARTGDSEYVLFDASSRADVLEGWLSFVAAIEQDGVAPFANLDCEDVSRSHVVLVLTGSKAGHVLADYTRARDLPAPGSVCSCMLDRIPCIVARLDVETPTYLLLVPPRQARALWRSLLSFVEVTPVGLDVMRDQMLRMLPWGRHLREDGRLRITVDELGYHGLVRDATDFVGARGLMQDDGGNAQ